MDSSEFMMELDIWHYLELKNTIQSTTGLDLVEVKSGITYPFSHNYARTKADSYDSLPLEKTLTFHNVIILIKSAFK